jgi:hypothetical protein
MDSEILMAEKCNKSTFCNKKRGFYGLSKD